ncbi:unnamed protein product [Timema podura]|uniref:Uncharacterized protein n=1 Tax=Timema podura TaxID=61482 RepID=A0ABN7P3G6_TIMPD|nr:unnamed protein product [Timema podura]
MERKTFTMKLEPEEDLEYILHHEENLEIKSEIDITIKSEESFKEEVHDHQEPDCGPGPITFPPIKEDLAIKLEQEPSTSSMEILQSNLLLQGSSDEGVVGLMEGVKDVGVVGHMER